jgi:hypothetical protein
LGKVTENGKISDNFCKNPVTVEHLQNPNYLELKR